MSFAGKLSPDTAKIGGIGRLEVQVADENAQVQWFKSTINCEILKTKYEFFLTK